MATDGSESAHGEATADFGFRRVRAAEKARLVRGVFDSVAGRYDLMNDLMSGGAHRLWKVAMVDALAPRPGMRLVDVAGGTGDIALRSLDRVEEDGLAVVADVNAEMLAVGRDRALDRGRLDNPVWIVGDAEALPLPDRSMDACTIAFGLRNVTRRADALAEMRRVLRPGGHFLCLEFSHVVVPLLNELYDLYSFRVVPALGRMVAGDADAYRYLVESIRGFPPQEELAAMMERAGFARVGWRNMSGGIVALHGGWRI
jgi:demethylmenaquinone methyltransferase / 2-methoxy-6-polyprenyl-1,4-benzoquinol methylase